MPLRYTAAVLVVAFVLLALACAVPIPPAPPAPQSTPTVSNNPQQPVVVPNAPRDLTREKPDFQWTTADLMKDYKGNGSTFRQKYHDKIIDVSGTVWDFEPFSYYGPKDMINVNLESNPGPTFCHMADREPWTKVIPGQPAKIRGRVPHDGEQIVEPLVDCVVVEPRQSSALALTAEQLCRDAQADAKQYSGKYVIVSGEIARVSKVGLTIVELKGDGQTKVRCQVYDRLSFIAAPLKVGQRIKMFGQYVALDKTHGVILDKALPITRGVEQEEFYRRARFRDYLAAMFRRG